MSSKRYKKLPFAKEMKPSNFENIISEVKKNCTTKINESIDLSFQINNIQKKNEITLRTVVNLPAGNGKKIKVAVVCEESKANDAKEADADIVGGDDCIEKFKGGN